MTYSFLPPHLQLCSEAVKEYLKKERGIAAFKIEEPIVKDGYKHDLSASTNDGYYLCVEVSENAYFSTLDAVVLDYRDRSVPVRLYVAIPKGLPNSELQVQLRNARRSGVGVIEVDEAGCGVIHEAISQSHAGLRSPDANSFPPKYRDQLSAAVHTFRSGNPAKGCSMMYDEIEDLSRKIAKKTLANGWWNGTPGVNLETGPWTRVMKALINKLVFTSCPPKLNHVLLSRVLGITGHRNDTGHKIKSKAALISRDKELRTRFEGAMDLLQNLIEASKPLRV